MHKAGSRGPPLRGLIKSVMLDDHMLQFYTYIDIIGHDTRLIWLALGVVTKSVLEFLPVNE